MPEESTTKNKRPSLRSRATTWAKTTYTEQKLALAYREGHRIFSALLSVNSPFELDVEFDRWREDNTPPSTELPNGDRVMVDSQAFKAAFKAGAVDAAESKLTS